MIRLLAINIGLFVVVSFVQAQTTEPMLFKVEYRFEHQADSTRADNVTTSNVYLYAGADNSLFTISTQSKPVTGSDGPAPAVNPKAIVVVGKPLVVVFSKKILSERIYQIPAEHKLVKTGELGFQSYKMAMELPAIVWKIYPQTKKLGVFTCQKATGSFGGRSYTAWFCPSLPYPYGPWKLNGLPGVILEASDSTGSVQFLYTSVTKSAELEYVVYDPYKPITISENAFEKAKRQFSNDPLAYGKAQLRDDTPLTEISFHTADGKVLSGAAAKAAIESEKKLTINNPLELTSRP